MTLEERKASWMAGACGAVAIGGFWFVRPDSRTVSLRVTEQWAPSPYSSDEERSAAMLFRLDRPTVIRDALRDGHRVAYRLLDQRGRIYPLFPLDGAGGSESLKLQWGYAHAPESPHLQVMIDGRVAGSVAVADVPKPRDQGLRAARNELVSLVDRGNGSLSFVPRRPIPSDEQWHIEMRRADYTPSLGATMLLPRPPSYWSPRRLSIPYADQARSIEVEMVRYRLVAFQETLRVPGLRLERRFGGTALVVDRSREIPNRLGISILLPKQDMGPRRQVRRDLRSVSMNLIARIPGNDERGEPSTRIGRPAQFEIVSPLAASLGLASLRVGSGIQASTEAPTRRIVEGPFEARIKTTVYRPVPIDRRILILPIERESLSQSVVRR